MNSEHLAISRYLSLQPTDYCLLDQFSVAQSYTEPSQLTLTITLRSDGEASNHRLELMFRGVRNLRVDWPPLNPVVLGPIEIGYITERQWEDLRFHVSDTEGAITFWCEDFDARIV